MKSKFFNWFLFIFLGTTPLFSQDYGEWPTIEKEKLLLDFEIFQQALEKLHSGMYWYTPKDSIDQAFSDARFQIDRDLNVLEFYKLLAPIVGLTRENHTAIKPPSEILQQANSKVEFLPLTVQFLGERMFVDKNGSGNLAIQAFDEIENINGKSPKEIVEEIGKLFPSDGYIKGVKYLDLEGFQFSKFYFLYYGKTEYFQLKIKDKDQEIQLKALTPIQINQNLAQQFRLTNHDLNTKDAPLTYYTVNDSIGYLGIHSFSNSTIKEQSEYKSLKKFLRKSFKDISDKNLKYLIVDVSENGGGSEGNEGILYSYFGDSYQKYDRVWNETNKAILDNGVDKPLKIKVYGIFENLFTIKKLDDGSHTRRNNRFGFGLMAYKKVPKHPFKGKTYVLIGRVTYSGGSEFANMMYSQGLATFVGQETGGGYYGNTSGYSREVVLPHSKIVLDIPTLRFEMNVEDKIPKGRGVLPDYEVIPSLEELKQDINAPLNFILKHLILEDSLKGA